MAKPKLRLVIDNTRSGPPEKEEKVEVVENNEWEIPQTVGKRSHGILVWVAISITLTVILNLIF